MLRLLAMALRFQWDSHRSNLPNLIAGAMGMIINNIIYLTGMWGMLFAGKPDNQPIFRYYLALNAMTMMSWGGLCFFVGGLRTMGDLVDDGALEPMLATPRDPLLLVAISKSHPMAFGDFVMGFVFLISAGAYLQDWAFAGRFLIAAMISAVGFAGVFIGAGSLSFFIPRGTAVGNLFTETTLSLSVYPTGKIFSGEGRRLLLLTPAAATGVLPIEAIERASFSAYLTALAVAAAVLGIGVGIFRLGVRRYATVSLISANR